MVFMGWSLYKVTADLGQSLWRQRIEQEDGADVLKSAFGYIHSRSEPALGSGATRPRSGYCSFFPRADFATSELFDLLE